MTTRATSAKGLQLAVQISDAWHYFGEVKAVPAIGESPQKIDVTHLGSNSHEYIKDIPDYSGDLAFTMNAQPFVSGGSADASNLNLIDSMDKNATYQFMIIYPALNQQVTLYGDWSWEMGAGSVSAAMEVTFTIIPRSAPVFTEYGVTQYSLAFSPVSTSGTGTGTMASQTIAVGGTVAAPACTFTAPTGKAFGSWNTQADGMGVTYQVGDTITMDTNYTLYAIWVTDNGE